MMKYFKLFFFVVILITAFKNVWYSFFAIGVLFFGLFVFMRPVDVINLQIRFYRLINWHMQPVSWEKEIKNTKMMGMLLLICVFLSCIYIWVQ